MSEYGIFSNEGLIEGDFRTLSEAQDAIVARYCLEDDLHAAECCHDHPENERECCEECNAEEDEEET